MAGNIDFLHIKRRTVGSSNELSLDVLDQKSVEADSKASKSSRLIKPPKSSQGSYHGVAGSSTLSGQAEVERRKKARHAHQMRLVMVCVLSVVILVGVGAFAIVKYHDSQVSAAHRVNELVGRLSQVDETLMIIDGMMSDPFDADKEKERASIQSKIPSLTTELNHIVVDAKSLSGFLVDDNAEIAAQQVVESARARSDMFTAAQGAFMLVSEANQQVNRANRIWNNVLNADQLAREAMSLANKATTPEAMTHALSKTRESLDGFKAALTELNDLSATYSVDLAGQKSYLAKKIEALEKAVETNESLLAGDRNGAEIANKAYAEADAEAVRLAEGLPPSIGSIVQDQFERNIIEHQKRYRAARDNAVEADSVIRAYLGL